MRTAAFRRRSPAMRGNSVPAGRRAASTAREATPQGVRPRRQAEVALQELELQLRERLQVTHCLAAIC